MFPFVFRIFDRVELITIIVKRLLHKREFPLVLHLLPNHNIFLRLHVGWDRSDIIALSTAAVVWNRKDRRFFFIASLKKMFWWKSHKLLLLSFIVTLKCWLIRFIIPAQTTVMKSLNTVCTSRSGLAGGGIVTVCCWLCFSVHILILAS